MTIYCVHAHTWAMCCWCGHTKTLKNLLSELLGNAGIHAMCTAHWTPRHVKYTSLYSVSNQRALSDMAQINLQFCSHNCNGRNRPFLPVINRLHSCTCSWLPWHTLWKTCEAILPLIQTSQSKHIGRHTCTAQCTTSVKNSTKRNVRWGQSLELHTCIICIVKIIAIVKPKPNW
jgi:hypothetical protein